jgi:xanthine dehydrogenase accessory factor
MNDIAVLNAVREAKASGRQVALATVIRTRGSVPRRAGSKMMIDPERGLVGTIGGGCGEADVIGVVGDVLRDRRPRIVRVELMDGTDTWSPAVCGGVMEIYVEPVE